MSTRKGLPSFYTREQVAAHHALGSTPDPWVRYLRELAQDNLSHLEFQSSAWYSVTMTLIRSQEDKIGEHRNFLQSWQKTVAADTHPSLTQNIASKLVDIASKLDGISNIISSKISEFTDSAQRTNQALLAKNQREHKALLEQTKMLYAEVQKNNTYITIIRTEFDDTIRQYNQIKSCIKEEVSHASAMDSSDTTHTDHEAGLVGHREEGKEFE